MSRKVAKRNPFWMYMEERKPGVVASGRTLTRGWQEMSEIVKDDWANMTSEEKQVYAEKARAYNDKNGIVNPTSPGSETPEDLEVYFANPKFLQSQQMCKLTPGVARVTKFKNMTPSQYQKHKKEIELETLLAHNKPMVQRIFTKPGWENQPIVVCHFTTYCDPNDDELLECIPAEVGLTAFSLTCGVMDNFARIIDIVNMDEDKNMRMKIPSGLGYEIKTTAQELGLPDPGTVPEFAKHKDLVQTMERFLEKHCGNQEPEFHVFALDSDFNVVSRCLEWLYAAANYVITIHVYSLSLYGHLASTQNSEVMSVVNAQKKLNMTEEERAEDYSAILAAAQSGVSSLRSAATPLEGSFVYAVNHPMSVYGLLLTEEAVDDAIKNVCNYKYYEELCCVYHMKKADKIFNCALSISNRYAFSLLEILTISNEVEIIKGQHYPDVDEAGEKTEKSRRLQWLKRWGLTKYEENMPDAPVVEDEFCPPIWASQRDCRPRDRRGQPGNRSPNRYSHVRNRRERRNDIARFYGEAYIYRDDPNDADNTFPNSFTGELPDVYATLRNASDEKDEDDDDDDDDDE